MRFSLIVATKNRTQELRSFLSSIKTQSHQDIEVIIVDQNPDKRLDPIINNFKKYFHIKHLRSEPGVSLARNKGLEKARGEVIAFPDDDCEYPRGLLLRLNEFFLKNKNVDGLSGRTVDREGKDAAGRFGLKKELISRSNIWNSHNCVSLFFRSNLTKKTGKFDEQMGLGRYFSSSEETDYLIRALKNKFIIIHDPSFKVYHPNVDELSYEVLAKRGLNYGRGVGRLLRKHTDFFSWRDYLRIFLGPILKTLTSRHLKYIIFNLSILRGRIEGYFRS